MGAEQGTFREKLLEPELIEPALHDDAAVTRIRMAKFRGGQMKIRIIIIVICIILLFIVLAIIDSFNNSATDEPVEADVIIMLGGDQGRLQKAAELYHSGYADYVMISPIMDEFYSQSRGFANVLGIPDEAIIEETEATSTYTNATLTLEMMEELDMDSAVVVTSDWHLKRSKIIFERVNENDFALTYVAALSDEGEKWHERSYARILWFREFYKIWGYRLGLYKFIDIPD